MLKKSNSKKTREHIQIYITIYSVFGEAEIEALCGNTDLCTISLGVALTAGNGRRNASREKEIWDYIGLSIEEKIGYNICKEKIQGFFSLSITTKYFSYNDMIELFRIGSQE